MSKQTMVWFIITGVLAAAFLLKALECYVATFRGKKRRATNPFELGKERDIFYVPGDCYEEDEE